MRFRVFEDFHSPELKSFYATGLTYTLKAENQLLAALLPQWVAEGKVKILADSEPQSRINAKGTVS